MLLELVLFFLYSVFSIVIIFTDYAFYSLLVEYATTDSVLDALVGKSVDISLLDAFVAAANSEKIERKKLRVKEVIKTTGAFGVVLSHELVRLEGDFRSQVTSKQNLIAEFVSNMTGILEVSTLQFPS